MNERINRKRRAREEETKSIKFGWTELTFIKKNPSGRVLEVLNIKGSL